MRRNLLVHSLLLIVLIGAALTVHAQKNNKEGIIITLQNDSVKGMIDYRDWTVNPDKIRFIANDGTVSVFMPGQIKGFVLKSNERYLSFKTSLDLTSFNINDIQLNHEPKVAKDTNLFLLALVQGKASLFYLKDKNTREHFYVTMNEEPPVELLIRKNYKTSSDGTVFEKSYITTLELFKGQLSLLLNDCPSMKKEIDQSSYNSASLRSIILHYNNCVQSGTQYVKKEAKVKVRIGALAGMSMVSLAFKGGEDEQTKTRQDLAGVSMDKAYTYMAGVSLHLIFPGNRESWSLINELVYRPYSTTAAYSINDIIRGAVDYHFSFDMAYLKLYSLVRYKYPSWKVHPFANIGISNGYAIKSDNVETKVKTDLAVPTTEIKPAFDNIRKYEFGIIGGLGVSWWKLNGEFRYEWAQGVSPESGMSGPENSLSFMISFIF